LWRGLVRVGKFATTGAGGLDPSWWVEGGAGKTVVGRGFFGAEMGKTKIATRIGPAGVAVALGSFEGVTPKRGGGRAPAPAKRRRGARGTHRAWPGGAD